MILHTASEVISFARNLEDKSAKFYEKLSAKYKQGREIFLDYSRENIKNSKQIESAYYGTISDAIEGTFAFNIEENNYTFGTDLVGNPEYAEILDMASSIEKLIARFYSDAAGQSQSLMADVPRIFKLIARKRSERIEKLEALLRSAQAGT